MRVNVYAEGMTNRIEITSKEIDGHQWTGLRFNDDSGAVTFWGKQDMRVMLRKALFLLDEHYDKPRDLSI